MFAETLPRKKSYTLRLSRLFRYVKWEAIPRGFTGLDHGVKVVLALHTREGRLSNHITVRQAFPHVKSRQ